MHHIDKETRLGTQTELHLALLRINGQLLQTMLYLTIRHKNEETDRIQQENHPGTKTEPSPTALYIKDRALQTSLEPTIHHKDKENGRSRQ